MFASVFLYFFSNQIVGVFTDDPQVIETAALFLTIVPISFGFQGIAMIVNSNLNTMNRPLTASLLIITQMLVIYIPLAYLGSEYNGIQGIFIALLISYIAGGILSYTASSLSLKKVIART